MNTRHFIELHEGADEKYVINCDAIYDVVEEAEMPYWDRELGLIYVYIDDGNEIEMNRFHFRDSFEKIKDALLKTGRFIMVHSEINNNMHLINIDHIKWIRPNSLIVGSDGAMIEMLWHDTTNSIYTTESYDDIIKMINQRAEILTI